MTVSGRSYFAYSDYEESGDGVVTSNCHMTKVGGGWGHDVTVRNWACFHGKKVMKRGEKLEPKYHKSTASLLHKVENIVFV